MGAGKRLVPIFHGSRSTNNAILPRFRKRPRPLHLNMLLVGDDVRRLWTKRLTQTRIRQRLITSSPTVHGSKAGKVVSVNSPPKPRPQRRTGRTTGARTKPGNSSA